MKGLHKNWEGYKNAKWKIIQDEIAAEQGFSPEVWTISIDDDTGWETDCGNQAYGLPKEVAAFIVDCLNKFHEQNE